jgi:hypothetical protein
VGFGGFDVVKIVDELEIDMANCEEEEVFVIEEYIDIHSQNY